jgi:hypothetical protein
MQASLLGCMGQTSAQSFPTYAAFFRRNNYGRCQVFKCRKYSTNSLR